MTFKNLVRKFLSYTAVYFSGADKYGAKEFNRRKLAKKQFEEAYNEEIER